MLSWTAIQLKTSVNDNEISVATGFFYQFDNRQFLITNYHVLSGRHPETNKPLHKQAAIPDTVTLCIPFATPGDSVESKPQPSKMQWSWRQLALYDDDGDPIWTQHPTFGRQFDVVAVPLSGLEETNIKAVNSSTLDLDKIQIYPGLEAFVIGFPRGMTGGAHFPIWKRATIATEPDIHLENLPKLFIDTATREGMSGSPVFAQEVGYWLPEGETDQSKANLGKGRRFIGVYSGRIGAEDEFKAQLGVVWKESELSNLLAAVPADE